MRSRASTGGRFDAPAGALSVRHDRVPRIAGKRTLFTRRRFQFAGALLFGALIPYFFRGFMEPANFMRQAAFGALAANILAVAIAFWTRLSIETFPGIRSSYVILPAALTGHGIVVALIVLTRIPYDRVAVGTGFALHVLWNYLVYFYAEHRIRRRIAVVPFGAIGGLGDIDQVEWVRLKQPRLEDTAGCNAIVADFTANLASEWEAFLADAALAGRIVYQVKQLTESLTGRVELQHLSENSFGSLLPARGYFHLKAAGDFLLAAVVLPFFLPVMAVIALAIRLDGRGPILFRQTRIGHAGRRITIYKFRITMAAPTLAIGIINGGVVWLVTRVLFEHAVSTAEFNKFVIGMQWFVLILFLPNALGNALFPRFLHAAREGRLDIRVAAGVALSVFASIAVIALAASLFTPLLSSLYQYSFTRDFVLVILAAAAIAGPVTMLSYPIIALFGVGRWLVVNLVLLGVTVALLSLVPPTTAFEAALIVCAGNGAVLLLAMLLLTRVPPRRAAGA